MNIPSKRLRGLQNCLKIQRSHGNWDYDPYMQGMANGMILAEAIIYNKTPNYLTAPKRWGKDIAFWTRIKWKIFGAPKPVSVNHL